MVHFCAVPGCSNRSDRENQLSYYRLPLKNKAVLKQWIHNIGRANLTLKDHTRVCSEHFANARGRMLRLDEVPTLKLPVLFTKVSSVPPRRAIIRHEAPARKTSVVTVRYKDASVNTELTGADLELLENQLRETEEKLQELEECADLKGKQHFPLSSVRHNDSIVWFYTGFGTFSAVMVCFNFLGPAVNKLNL